MAWKFSPFTATLDYYESGGVSTWKAPVANVGALPGSGNSNGDARIVLDTHEAFVWNGSAWIYLNDVKIGAFSGSSNAAGISVSSDNTLTLHPADDTNPGAVTTGTQTFAGNKTFEGTIIFNDDITANGIIYAQNEIDVVETGGTDSLLIGATNADVITIGNSSSVVNFNGTVNNNNVTNLVVTDKLITVNDGGGAASGTDSGLEIEEDSLITGYAKTSADRNSWRLKAPNTAGDALITPGASGITLNQSSHDPVTVSDTNSIDLTLSTQQISADLRISNNASDAGYVLIENNIESTGTPGLRTQVAISDLETALDDTYVNTAGDTMTGGLAIETASNQLVLGVTNTVTVSVAAQNASVTATIPDLDGNDDFVFEDHAQTLTNKTLTAPVITAAELSVDDDGSTFNLNITSNSNPVLTADRTLTIDVDNADRTLAIPGNATISGTNTGDVTLAAVGSSPNGNAATLTGQQLNLEPADATNPGVITASTQTIGGNKTFNGSIQTNTSVILQDPGVGTNTITVQAPTLAGDYTLTLPTTDGNNDQVLRTDGSGVLSWVNHVPTSSGDIVETSFSIANNQAVAANVTNFAFANASIRAFKALVSVAIDADTDLFEEFDLKAIQKASSWEMSVDSVGDASQITFSITSLGQVQYTSGNYTGFVSGTMKFRAWVTTI